MCAGTSSQCRHTYTHIHVALIDIHLQQSGVVSVISWGGGGAGLVGAVNGD